MRSVYRRERKTSAAMVAERSRGLSAQQVLDSSRTQFRWEACGVVLLAHQFYDVEEPYILVCVEKNEWTTAEGFLHAMQIAEAWQGQE